MKKKIAVFSITLALVISYIIWIFYMSEPKYIDNPTQEGKVEKYDLVSISDKYSGVDIGMVIQLDTTSFVKNHYALVKLTKWNNSFDNIIINTPTPNYKIIGRGTFYHKVNHLIGFNIMFLANFFVAIIAIIIASILISLVREFMGYRSLF